ncbi:AAA family ATPase [Paracoccus sanguinis]|uniref:ATPase family associated with various cellular activities (AAA) n=1 Tax=Paracoccus sanguinis TaxID=1545044 RepID=A0A1H2W083_9RHOB|nr:AAA family ATPase [Paracoccus sanguinis]SDW74028.1 ATPase family associated with various cellular activities (AAA) [Paracoccus sanguinis]
MSFIAARGRRFVERRDARLEALPSKSRFGPQLTPLARGGRAALVAAHEADEIAAALHARGRWMDAASCQVMKDLHRRTAQGTGLAEALPMILSGPPGISRSAWARHLADLLGVPVIRIDLSAAQSGAFSLVGVERGWESAGMGMLTQTILTERIANPVVIVDEIGLARETLATTGGGTLAGLIPALMSLIEPTTAQNWTDPYLRVGFDMSRVT